MKPTLSSLKQRLAILCLAVGLLGQVRADVVIGNLAALTPKSGTPAGIGIVGKGVSFIMGKGYVLQSATLRLYRVSSEQFAPIVELWSADDEGKPVAAIETLVPPAVTHAPNSGNYVFKPRARVVLEANGKYCLVVRTSAQAPNEERDFLWSNGSPTVLPTGGDATFLGAVWGSSYDEPYTWAKKSTQVNWFEIQGQPL